MHPFYSTLAIPEPDALHSVMAKYHTDQRSHKIDLSVAVYRDALGHSPVMKAIKQAERVLLNVEVSKSYLGLSGVERFLSAMIELLFVGCVFDRYAAIQSLGGSGGIRLAVEIAALANDDLTVHIGVPTWPNHFSICDSLGIRTDSFDYFNKDAQTLCVDEIFATIERAKAGDIIVLHGPCHNPTGADLSSDQFLALIRAAEQRGVIPLIDAAYYGLANALEEDLMLLRLALEMCPQAFLVMSCSKVFGLYRERTGVLFAATPNETQKALVQGTLEKLARSNYSMPPAHGASSVAVVLSNDKLRELWLAELNEMQSRIKSIRCQLAELGGGLVEFSAIKSQKGILSLLPIEEVVVERLADEHAIFMPSSGRINIAGIKTGDAERLVEAVKSSV